MTSSGLSTLWSSRKHRDGRVQRLHQGNLLTEEAEQSGGLIGALVGFGLQGDVGDELSTAVGSATEQPEVLDDIWYVDDVLPVGGTAVIALIEHRWAISLRDGIREAGGVGIGDAWVHPLDLVAIGLAAREEFEHELRH